jgi:hypothetical protein
MDLKETAWEFVDLMSLTQNMDQWRALVNSIMNLLVPLKVKSLCLTKHHAMKTYWGVEV